MSLLYFDNPVVVGAASSQIAGPNPKRKALLIGANNAARVTVRFGDVPAVLDVGITIQAGGQPLYLDEQRVGAALYGAVQAIASAGGTNIGVLDVFGP